MVTRTADQPPDRAKGSPSSEAQSQQAVTRRSLKNERPPRSELAFRPAIRNSSAGQILTIRSANLTILEY
ncbi:Hypothetical protein NTJ_15499 [Nesidiocoris tenuis]|uniref:Uncharacterized protein n=1 Tax=Nesidiocoris tenuis TaxID=355587 RepID=A0ABN7BED7_9HEMI|nr:Hypothetical protein NTJ_15499 [Nesidiocoris tenuis]